MRKSHETMAKQGQLSFWTASPSKEILSQLVYLAGKAMVLFPDINYSEGFLGPFQRLLTAEGFILASNTSLATKGGPKMMADIIVATSPPIAIEMKAGRLQARDKYQVQGYANCPWIAGVLLIVFLYKEHEVQAWWLPQGERGIDANKPDFEE